MRIYGSHCIKQKCIVAFCLSQLSYSVKSIQKLTVNIKLYEHVLDDEEVLKQIRHLITMSRKFANEQLKKFLNDFEIKLESVYSARMELVMNYEVQKHSIRAKKLHDKRRGRFIE